MISIVIVAGAEDAAPSDTVSVNASLSVPGPSTVAEVSV